MDKKREIFAIIALFILIIGIFTIFASVNKNKKWHDNNNILITIEGYKMTIQEAIDNNVLSEGAAQSYTTEIPNPGHQADEIWVSVQDGEMYLLDAIVSANKLCPASPLKHLYEGPDDKSEIHHYADEIEISPGKSFQDAIDNGEFCCAPKTCASLGYVCGTSWDDGCGGTINCGDCPRGDCKGGTCCSHDEVRCYDNDKYYYDSCGNREEKSADCGEEKSCWESMPHCVFPYDNLREYTLICHHRGCSNGECYLSSSRDTKREKCSGGRKCVDGECIYPDTGNGEGDGKVICTEFYNLGFLDEETYKMDLEYASKHLSLEVIRGYQAWAIPVVKAMRKNPEIREFALPLVDSFMEEIAYRSGKKETSNKVGALFLDRGVPLFERIGKHINEPDWRDLFEEVNPIFLNFMEIFQYKENKYDSLVRNYFTEEKVEEMYYDIKEKSNNPYEFADAILDELEKAVEEIESKISSIEK